MTDSHPASHVAVAIRLYAIASSPKTMISYLLSCELAVKINVYVDIVNRNFPYGFCPTFQLDIDLDSSRIQMDALDHTPSP